MCFCADTPVTTRLTTTKLLSVVVVILLLACVNVNASSSANSNNNIETGGGSSGGGGASYYSSDVWIRNLDTQLIRLGSRLDQLMIRMDHLDSRVGRVQSQGHLRFDSIETSMQTTRQRLDLWSNQLNLLEEQLSRKWKNMETRFDSLVASIDSKLDSKFNLIQRDNRRHNEFLSSSFNSVIISQEKLGERVTNSIADMTSSVLETRYAISNTTVPALARVSRECAVSANNSDNAITLLNSLAANLTTYEHNTVEMIRPPSPGHYHHASLNQSSVHHLVTTKVTNMFEELVTRSNSIEEILKDTFSMSNATRREVQDGFRAILPSVNQIGGGGRSLASSGSSTEVMSMVVDALASVETMSTALGRRMTELSRSIEERFEMVSMTLNGFLESCLRIQDKVPLLEEQIVDVLGRILDAVDNSTRNATETWHAVHDQLARAQRKNTSSSSSSSCSENRIIEQYLSSLQQKHQQHNHQPPETHSLSHHHQELTSNRSRSTWSAVLHRANNNNRQQQDYDDTPRQEEDEDDDAEDEDNEDPPPKLTPSGLVFRSSQSNSHHLRHQHSSLHRSSTTLLHNNEQSQLNNGGDDQSRHPVTSDTTTSNNNPDLNALSEDQKKSLWETWLLSKAPVPD